MNGLLMPFSFLVDFVKPVSALTVYGYYYNGLCGYLSALFELARSDTMAYINLTGLGYCDAARYC